MLASGGLLQSLLMRGKKSTCTEAQSARGLQHLQEAIIEELRNDALALLRGWQAASGSLRHQWQQTQPQGVAPWLV